MKSWMPIFKVFGAVCAVTLVMSFVLWETFNINVDKYAIDSETRNPASTEVSFALEGSDPK